MKFLIEVITSPVYAGESDKLCDDMVALMQRTTSLKGAVTCVRAVNS